MSDSEITTSVFIKKTGKIDFSIIPLDLRQKRTPTDHKPPQKYTRN